MKIIFILFLVLILTVPRLIAQKKSVVNGYTGMSIDSTNYLVIKPHPFDEIKTREQVNWHQMISNVPSDLSLFPDEAFTRNRLPLFAILAAGTGALMLIDQKGWDANKRLYNNSSAFHDFSDMGVRFGNEKYHFLLAGLFTAYGFIGKNSRALKPRAI